MFITVLLSQPTRRTRDHILYLWPAAKILVWKDRWIAIGALKCTHSSSFHCFCYDTYTSGCTGSNLFLLNCSCFFKTKTWSPQPSKLTIFSIAPILLNLKAIWSSMYCRDEEEFSCQAARCRNTAWAIMQGFSSLFVFSPCSLSPIFNLFSCCRWKYANWDTRTQKH